MNGPWNPNGTFVGPDGKLSPKAAIWLSIFTQTVANSGVTSSADFVIQTVIVGQQSNQFQNDTGFDLVPSSLSMMANVASAVGATLIDIQTSADQVTWTSILQGGVVTLPKGKTRIPSVTAFASGAKIPNGHWGWALVKIGSATDAQQVALQLNLEGAPQ